jgi:transposase
MTMDRYIGLDAHSQSCTLAVVGPSGRRLGSQVVETNGAALVAAVRAIARPRHLVLEEGTQSGWLHEILSPHVDELVVLQATQAPVGQKSDERDAFALAEALRVGNFGRRVFKAPGRFARLRAIAHTYTTLDRDLVRTKNRLKAVFRSRGVDVTGQGVYGPNRAQWLEQLPPAARVAADLLYRELDCLTELKADAGDKLVVESHEHPISRVLETCPGLGPIRVALLIPVVITPERFRTARQFWAYAGLGIVMQSSADWVRAPEGWSRAKVHKTRGLSKQCNRRLKYIFKQAALTVLMKPDHPFRKHYDRLLEAGTKPNNARLTVARKLAALTLAMWKQNKEYDHARLTKN